MEQTPAYRPAPGAWPAVAFDGTQYLVVWEDHRLRRPVLYGGRVTAEGTALDPFGFPILDRVPESQEDREYKPAIAFDGTNFLVVTEVAERIIAVRVSPAGEVLDPDGILIASANGASQPSLAVDGQQYRVAWFEHEFDYSGNGIRSARVKPDGTVLDPGGIEIIQSIASSPPALSFDGTNYLLSWVDFDCAKETYVVDARRMSVDGTPLDNVPLRIDSGGESGGAVVEPGLVGGFDGTNHVIAWARAGVIQASRVTPQGTILDPEGFVVKAGDGGTHRLEIAADGEGSLLVWSASYNQASNQTWAEAWADPVRMARIAIDGTTTVYPDNAFPAGLEATVAVHPEGGLLMWRDGAHTLPDHLPIVGTRLDIADMPVAGSVVAPALPASRQDVKAVASGGSDFFVSWTDTRDPTGEGKALYGARVGADARPLDLESIQFTTERVDSADVVFDGANFVITWVGASTEPESPFHSVRVSPAGERLDAEPLHPPLCGQTVGGASDGTHTLLVGRECFSDLSAVLVNREGEVASDLIPIPGPGSERVVASFTGTDYLVVWRDYDAEHSELHGQRVTQSGELAGQPFLVAIGQDFIQHLDIAAGGGNHLVVWEGGGLWAARVSAQGQVFEAQLLAPLNYGGWDPGLDSTTCSYASVAFDGENFVVAWRARTIPDDASSMDLYAAEVSPRGEVSPPFMISGEPEREGAVVVTAGEGGVLAAYNRFIPGAPHDTRRAMARLLFP